MRQVIAIAADSCEAPRSPVKEKPDNVIKLGKSGTPDPSVRGRVLVGQALFSIGMRRELGTNCRPIYIYDAESSDFQGETLRYDTTGR